MQFTDILHRIVFQIVFRAMFIGQVSHLQIYFQQSTSHHLCHLSREHIIEIREIEIKLCSVSKVVIVAFNRVNYSYIIHS